MSKKNLSEEKKVSRKKFCEKKTLAKKKNFSEKKVLEKNNFSAKKIFCWIRFFYKKDFLAKSLSKFFFPPSLSKIYFGPRKCFPTSMKFYFWPKYFSGPSYVARQTFFRQKSIFLCSLSEWALDPIIYALWPIVLVMSCWMLNSHNIKEL